MKLHACVIAAALVGVAGPALAETATLGADRDNTLFDTSLGPADASSGAGPHLYAGRTNFDGLRRAVLRFDVAGAVPAGATIDSVTVTLFMDKTILGPFDFSLHALTADWGEAGSNSGGDTNPMGLGQGAPAQNGDATWDHTFFPGSFWTTPGGDFVAAASATQSVDQIGSYSWTSAQLAADVQAWVDGADNHGWALLGDETQWSAKRFSSRENPEPAQQPQVTIEFTVGTGPECPGDANGDLMVDMDDIVAIVMDFGMPGPGANGGDVDMSGFVDIDDVILAILNFGLDCTPE